MHRLAVGALAGLAALAGCLGEKTTRCANGATCPDPLVCTGNTVEPFCEERISVEQCMGKPDETPCMFGTEKNGYCLTNTCVQCSPNFSFCKYDEWTPMAPTVNGVTKSTELMAIWAASATDVYVIGKSGTMIRWNGRQWSDFTTGVGVGADYESIWGFDANNMYVVTANTNQGAHSFRYDGAQWAPQTTAPGSITYAVSGTSADDVFVVGVARGHYATGTWTNVAGSLLYGVWAYDGTAIAVGTPSPNNVTRFTAPNVWTQESTMTNHILFDVQRVGTTEFAVGRTNTGGAPAVMRHEAAWEDMTAMLPTSVSGFELNAVLALSPTDVYAVGKGGTILHYDGAQWIPMTTNVGVTLNELYATSADVFAVGAAGTVLRLSR